MFLWVIKFVVYILLMDYLFDCVKMIVVFFNCLFRGIKRNLVFKILL